jgi:hypothetical protein
MIDNLIITHGIKGYPYHFFSEGNMIYQRSHVVSKRTLPEQIKKKQLNGTTRGFMIYGKFKSLTALERLRYPLTKVIFNVPDECPF